MAAIQEAKRILQLDGIRGIAVSMVVLFHYFGGNDDQSLIANKAIRWIFNRGWSGVDLFFILSGFLIGGILLDNKVDGRFMKVFYYRRFLRIFPLYYLLLAITWAFYGLTTDWPAYILYLQNVLMALYKVDQPALGITWSLAVEEHFYLILPALIAFASRRRLVQTIGFFVILALILRAAAVLVERPHQSDFAYYFTFCRMDDLMLGVGLALAVRSETIMSWLRTAKTPLYIALFVLLLALPVISWIDLKFVGFNLIFGLPVYATLYSVLILIAVCHPTSIVATITKLSWLRWIGERAYSVYLFHQIILIGAKFLITSNSPIAAYTTRALALSTVLLAAYLLWRLVEKPLIQMGHRARYSVSERIECGRSTGIKR